MYRVMIQGRVWRVFQDGDWEGVGDPLTRACEFACDLARDMEGVDVIVCDGVGGVVMTYQVDGEGKPIHLTPTLRRVWSDHERANREAWRKVNETMCAAIRERFADMIREG